MSNLSAEAYERKKQREKKRYAEKKAKKVQFAENEQNNVIEIPQSKLMTEEPDEINLEDYIKEAISNEMKKYNKPQSTMSKMIPTVALPNNYGWIIPVGLSLVSGSISLLAKYSESKKVSQPSTTTSASSVGGLDISQLSTLS